jgi:hypothetical protein
MKALPLGSYVCVVKERYAGAFVPLGTGLLRFRVWEQSHLHLHDRVCL